MNFWTKARRHHAAESLRAIALGVLVYFGFQAQHNRAWALLGSFLVAGLLEGLALMIINEDIKEPEK